MAISLQNLTTASNGLTVPAFAVPATNTWLKKPLTSKYKK